MERLYNRNVILSNILPCQVKILSAQIHWMRRSKFTPDEPRKVCIVLLYALFDPLMPSQREFKNITLLADRGVVKEAFKSGKCSFFDLTCTILGTGKEATVKIPILLNIAKFIIKIK